MASLAYTRYLINMVIKQYFIFFFLFSACAGYHVKNRDNPFDVYGVDSIAVPLFLNQSLSPHLAGPMTSEIIDLLRDYPGLSVESGNSDEADAVLLGIIQSDEHYRDMIQTNNYIFTDDQLRTSIGNRKPFYIPLSSTQKVKLRLVLIKNPRRVDIELLYSKIGEQIKNSDRIIFNELLELTTTTERVINPVTASPDSPGVVNNTKNSYLFKKSAQDLARSARLKVKDEVLSAF
jgi:hypothetical protein